MELLKEINETDVRIKITQRIKYNLRKAARAIIIDEGKIALLYVSKHNYHKLPGGGLEGDESVEIALKREVKEETGCSIDIGGEVGLIIEYRNKDEILQMSYCFIAKVIENLNELELTESEKSEGFQLKWVKISEAMKLLKNDKPNNYEGKFIQKRDFILLKKAEEIMNRSMD